MKNVSCPHCKNQTQMTVDSLVKYAHLYWIPLFPIRRTVVLSCHICGDTYQYSELPDQLKNKFRQGRHHYQGGIPVWTFSGLFLLSLLFAYGFYRSGQNEDLQANYLSNPKTGDRYQVVDEASGFYSLMRIDSIGKDSLYLRPNQFMAERQTGLFKIDRPENYTAAPQAVSKAAIRALYTKDKTLLIYRP